MDNPEEVLQALDEFQKMRPSEIPRELEDYLCFVAKTGDPIYQWSLIKPLFREKLVRVMTDFYESCPTLDLATSPNLEHFNYDIMKCNLLELLESFANAPFTVQRICELLTAPRKEYNRVDKFMRAIEKNILVVSTKEPGPAARRSENGDSMVNGSIDDETPTTQPSHEVEMESWVKDCTTDATAVATLPVDDVPLVEAALVAEKLSKSIDSTTTGDTTAPNLTTTLSASSSTPEMTVTSFITAAHEINTNLTSLPVSDSIISGSHVQNSSGTIAEPTNIINEAIMNEDTSSQPSLDSESDENELHGTKKLQTTFQAKDFVKNDNKPNKFYPENGKEIKSIELTTNCDDNTSPPDDDDDSKSSCDSGSEHQEKRPRIEVETSTVLDRNDNSQSCTSETISEKIDDNSTSESSDSDSVAKTELIIEPEATKDDKLTNKPVDAEIKASEIFAQNTPDLTSNSTSDSQSSNESETIKENTQDSNNLTGETTKIIIEEPVFEEITTKSPTKNLNTEKIGVIIEEATDDDVKSSEENTNIPQAIPIIEEPRDELTCLQQSIVTGVSDYNKITEEQTSSLPTIDENDETTETIVDNLVATTQLEADVRPDELITDISSINNDITDVGKNEPAESMEVDSEESVSGFIQDEPMEQEQEQSMDQLTS